MPYTQSIPTTLRLQRKKLSSYGGTTVVTDVITPKDARQLRAALDLARREKRKITFRAGGRSFDTQALNDALVISMECFNHIDVDLDDSTVRVGAGTTWGEILAETSRHGLVPYVTVTSSGATAGGTLSADCLSRFSPTCGKEGVHVQRFRFMKLDGQELVCSRDENSELFRAVIGGLGYLGAVLEITYDLLSLGYKSPEIAVETHFDPFRGVDDLAAKLLSPLQESCSCSIDVGTGGAANAYAVSAVVYMNKKRQGVIMTSHYRRVVPSERHPTVLHQPRRFAHRAVQFAALFRVTRQLGWWIAMNVSFRRPRVYVDELANYTFFQDGNEAVKRFARRVGLKAGVRQQTYLIPWHPDAEAGHALAGFLTVADNLLDSRRLLPALIDVLYVPPDHDGEYFLLSASHEFSGFAISIAFEKALSSRFDEEERALHDLATLCFEQFGGRVHLIKHVYADPELLRRMYPGLPEMKRLKRSLDPDHMLSNEFLERVFPDLAA